MALFGQEGCFEMFYSVNWFNFNDLFKYCKELLSNLKRLPTLER